MIFNRNQFSVWHEGHECDPTDQEAAEIAQKLFDEWVKKNIGFGMIVYGYQDFDNGGWWKFCDLECEGLDTHKAILIDIEEIKKHE